MPKLARSDEPEVNQVQRNSKIQILRNFWHLSIWHSFDIWILKFDIWKYWTLNQGGVSDG
jgi:hypothetical protein